MKVSRKSVAVVWLLAMFFATAQFGASTQTAWSHESASGEQEANDKGGRAINCHAIEGLELSILSVSADSNDSIRLKVAFENVSDRDIVLNLGMMLANGKVQLPEGIRLTLTDESGRSRQLHFFATTAIDPAMLSWTAPLWMSRFGDSHGFRGPNRGYRPNGSGVHKAHDLPCLSLKVTLSN